MGITEEKFRELYEKYKNLVFRQVYDMTVIITWHRISVRRHF